MSSSSRLRALRDALGLLPVDWIVWSLDAAGVVRAFEGPALPGTRDATAVGRGVWEAFAGDNPVLVFAHRVMRGPERAELVSGGRRWLATGGPLPDGGAAGIAILLGAAAGADDELEDGPAREVMELTRPVEEIGARAGDLLVWNPDRPEAVGLYRELGLEAIPDAVAEGLALTNPFAFAAAAPPPPAPGDSARSPRGRAAHLRLLS